MSLLRKGTFLFTIFPCERENESAFDLTTFLILIMTIDVKLTKISAQCNDTSARISARELADQKRRSAFLAQNLCIVLLIHPPILRTCIDEVKRLSSIVIHVIFVISARHVTKTRSL
jgi:hypothetical protein